MCCQPFTVFTDYKFQSSVSEEMCVLCVRSTNWYHWITALFAMNPIYTWVTRPLMDAYKNRRWLVTAWEKAEWRNNLQIQSTNKWKTLLITVQWQQQQTSANCRLISSFGKESTGNHLPEAGRQVCCRCLAACQIASVMSKRTPSVAVLSLTSLNRGRGMAERSTGLRSVMLTKRASSTVMAQSTWTHLCERQTRSTLRANSLRRTLSPSAQARTWQSGHNGNATCAALSTIRSQDRRSLCTHEAHESITLTTRLEQSLTDT